MSSFVPGRRRYDAHVLAYTSRLGSFSWNKAEHFRARVASLYDWTYLMEVR